MHAHADMPRNPYLTVKTVILVGLLWICHDAGLRRSAPLPPRPGKHASRIATGRSCTARYRTSSAGRGRRTCELPRFGAPAHPRHPGAAWAALPAARPVKALAAVRCEPARGPLKANPTRRWAYSSRPSRLTKFRGAQPSSRLCCVTANVGLVPHHAGRQLELGTAKDKLFELPRRILADFEGKNAYSWVSNHNRPI